MARCRLLCSEGEGLGEQSDSTSSGRDYHSIGVASTLGFGIAVSLALLVGGGVWLDSRLDSAPWFTLLGLALGLISAGYQLYELVLVSRKNVPNGPLGRRLASRSSKTRQDPE